MALEYKLSYTAEEIDERLGRVASNAESIENLSAEHSELVTTVGAINDQVSGLGEGIDGLNDGISSLNETVSGLNEEIETINESITGLDNKINEKVSNTTTVNGKALSEDITLTASDVNADEKGTAEAKASQALSDAKAYTNEKVTDLASTTVVDHKISAHNTATDSHNDIRDLITDITNRLNALADSDDTTLDQMSELVDYIKDNRELIESVTTNKVNVADIVDDLTTNVTDKPLAASQGTVVKGLIDALQEEVDKKSEKGHVHSVDEVTNLQDMLNGKAASDHNHDSAYDKKGAADTALSSAKEYANTLVSGKADATHKHAISDIENLQEALDEKVAKSYVDEEVAALETEIAKKADTDHTHVGQEEFSTAEPTEQLTGDYWMLAY